MKKNETKATFVGHSDDGENFSQRSLLTNTQVSKIDKAFASCSPANIKLSKTQSKMIQLEEVLGKVLEPLIKQICL